MSVWLEFMQDSGDKCVGGLWGEMWIIYVGEGVWEVLWGRLWAVLLGEILAEILGEMWGFGSHSVNFCKHFVNYSANSSQPIYKNSISKSRKFYRT
jgi:hypothetical protein